MRNRVAVAAMGAGAVPDYPADFGQGIIAVGATDCNDEHLSLSRAGPHIDVVAPGDSIWSTWPFSELHPLGYDWGEGTSASAPQVSGLAALLLGVPGRKLYNDDVEQIIRLSADDKGPAGFDSLYGMGRINAYRALKFLEFPYELRQLTAAGGAAVDSTSQRTLKFFVPPDTSYHAGLYRVRRFEVRKNVTFPAIFDSTIVGVWGRGVETTGYNPELDDAPPPRNWNMGWCEPVPGTITPSGCTLRTFVYEVKDYPSGQNLIGWWPVRHDSVQFGFTVLGTTTLSDADDVAATVGLAPRLWSANPLRPGATISLAIPQAGRVRIDVFDVAGRRVRVLQDGELAHGCHELRWDGLSDKGGSVASGLYFVRLETQARVVTRKLVVLD
jgi:hypothetical protein